MNISSRLVIALFPIVALLVLQPENPYVRVLANGAALVWAFGWSGPWRSGDTAFTACVALALLVAVATFAAEIALIPTPVAYVFANVFLSAGGIITIVNLKDQSQKTT